ncbi:MAG: GLUG motif-containing protein [Bacteroidota bacterium]
MKLLWYACCIAFTSLLLFSTTAAQTATAPSSGDGTSGNPYQIATLDNLYWITQNNTQWDKYYIQTADIDASSTSGWDSGNGFSPIGSNATSFTGSYDGNGYTISGLTISRSGTDYIGLFGFISDATVKNITLTGINYSGNSLVGGVVGFSTGFGLAVIQKCSATGTITSTASQSGGLIGKTQAGTTVSESFCNVTVSSTNGNYLGGFIGHNDQSSTITNCYSRGNVSSTNGNQVGGFAGVNQSATITNCYSTGSASGGGSFVGGLVGAVASSTVNNSFWDTEASGNGTSYAGTGKTTALMKTQSTFTDAGWDFTNIWEIVGSNYPRLQSNPDEALPVELVSFTASAKQHSVELLWKTVTEVNNYGFEIERTVISNQLSAISWSKAGFVEGNGTSNAPKEYSFRDRNVDAEKYSYRLKQIDRNGKFSYSHAVEITIAHTPKEFALEQNYPNPFNPSTVISYQLPVNSPVTMKVYDVIGREVATLVNEVKEAGSYSVTFDASKLSSGIYFARLQNGDKVQLKKMLMMK